VKVTNRAPVATVTAPVRASQDEPKLFAPEGSAEGCASGECLPETTGAPTPSKSNANAAGNPSPAPAKTASSSPTAPVAKVPPTSNPSTTAVQSPMANGSTARVPAPAAASEPVEPLPADEPDELPGRVETEHDRWAKAVEAMRQASPRHGKSLSYARFLGFTPEGVRVAFAPDAAFHKAQVTGMSRAIVEAELTRALGRPMKLQDESNTTAYQAAPKSIAEVEASDRQTRETGIDRKVREHPAIRSILKHLGGAVEHIAYLEPAQQPRSVAPAGGADDTTTPEE
jgi:hypothetical protein